MQQDLQWRSEPLYLENLENDRIERTDPYGRHVSNNVSSEAFKDTRVYRKALHTLVADNQVLARENEVLRNFLLLKKENCDLKTLDIITNALAMCDEKLNEFITNLHNFADGRKPVPSANVDTRPQYIVNSKPDKYQPILEREEPQSPSYGASFPETHYSELEAYDDNQISMSPTDNRRYPKSYKSIYEHDEYSDNKHCRSRYVHDDSASYGQSFPQVDYNELLEDTAQQRKHENTTEYEVAYRNKYPNKSPVIVSVPTYRTKFSPIQRNVPNRVRQQGTMPNTRTINQPLMRSFSATPRQSLRTMTPTRPQNETRDHFHSQQKNISATQFDPRLSKFSSYRPARYSLTPPRTTFYDSLEAREMENKKFTTHPSSHRPLATSLPNYQRQDGRFPKAPMNDVTPQNTNIIWSGDRKVYKGKMHSSSTGNADSFCQCSSPIYTSSGRRQEMDFIDSKMLDKTNCVNSETSTGQTLRNSSPTASRYTRQQEVGYDCNPSTRHPPSPNFNERSDFEIVHGNGTVIIKSPKSSLKKRVIEQDNQKIAEQSQMKQDESIIGTQAEQLRILNGHSKTVANNYKGRDTNRSTENNQENNEKSVWINITQRARVLTEGHDSGQDPHNSVDSKVYTTAIEHQQREDSGQPTVVDFQVTEPPLYTSTPKQSYTKKEVRDISAHEIDQRLSTKLKDKTCEQLLANEALNLTGVSPRDTALDTRTDSAKMSNVSSKNASEIDSTGNRQEFDESLAEVVGQAHPKLGRSEIVNSVLYRPVDTLTGYTPNVTLLTTSMALRSKPSGRLVGEIAFQLDRRIMELVIGQKRSSTDKKKKRSRYYGYSIVNINQLIRKEASLKSQSNPDDIQKVEEEMQQRLEHVLATLKPFGYDLDVHSYFTQDMVNKYGLMKEAPHMDTVEGFGLHEHVILRMLLGRILGHGPILDNMLILLDCLCILSYFDKSPLFMW